jgi:hypothetical protein
MRTTLVKSTDPTDRLVYWIKEREAVRLAKEAGRPKPWTDDEILQTYRFCNVRRMDDKVSRWLMENWYGPYRDHPNMLAAVALARFVNLPDSLDLVTGRVFRDASPCWDSIKSKLRLRRNGGRTVFNGAYMVRGNTTKSPDKIGTVVDEYVGALVKANAAVKSPDGLVDRGSMEATHERVASVYGFGSFMAGQVVADLRHAVSGTWADKDDWAPVGPGSARGLAMTLYWDDWEKKAARYVSKPNDFTTDLICRLVPILKKRLPTSITARLEAHDYQNCMCEVFGYNKVLFGLGQKKARYPGAPNTDQTGQQKR